MKLSGIKINGKALHQGGWVSEIPQLPGVRLRVRGNGNLASRRLRAQLIREVPKERQKDGYIDPADEDAIENRLLSETILLDWDGLEDDDGQPIEYTAELAAELIEDPDFLVFRSGVAYAAAMVATTKSETQERDAGN